MTYFSGLPLAGADKFSQQLNRLLHKKTPTRNQMGWGVQHGAHIGHADNRQEALLLLACEAYITWRLVP